mmetsp:Transcript_2023/g.5266  ORF Transcript_2023/g.5266 Transcript_2023/m.5266 type:complete len:341 (-) Transcript_2023:225-1247(-)
MAARLEQARGVDARRRQPRRPAQALLRVQELHGAACGGLGQLQRGRRAGAGPGRLRQGVGLAHGRERSRRGHLLPGRPRGPAGGCAQGAQAREEHAHHLRERQRRAPGGRAHRAVLPLVGWVARRQAIPVRGRRPLPDDGAVARHHPRRRAERLPLGILGRHPHVPAARRRPPPARPGRRLHRTHATGRAAAAEGLSLLDRQRRHARPYSGGHGVLRQALPGPRLPAGEQPLPMGGRCPGGGSCRQRGTSPRSRNRRSSRAQQQQRQQHQHQQHKQQRQRQHQQQRRQHQQRHRKQLEDRSFLLGAARRRHNLKGCRCHLQSGSCHLESGGGQQGGRCHR